MHRIGGTIEQGSFRTDNGVAGSGYLPRLHPEIVRCGSKRSAELLGGGIRTVQHRLAASAGSLEMGSSLLSSSSHFMYELVGVSIPRPSRNARKTLNIEAIAREIHMEGLGVGYRGTRLRDSWKEAIAHQCLSRKKIG